jgi:hypothetical protein
MGYYTNYSLEIKGKGPVYNRLMGQLDMVVPNDVYGYSLSSLVNDEAESIKWYNYEEDMRAMSKDWPNVLFTMKCIGEDHEMWACHFMNGTSKKCDAKITFDEPDMTVLKYIPDAELRAIEERKAELKASIAKMKAELDSLG